MKATPFTDKALGNLEPRATRFEVYDDVAVGLELRVTPTGAKTFRYRKSGHPAITIGPLGDGDGEFDVEGARLEVLSIIKARKNGREPDRERKKEKALRGVLARTVRSLLEEYVVVKRWRKLPLSKETVNNYRRDLAFTLAEYYDLPIGRLTPEKFVELHQRAAVPSLRETDKGPQMLGSPHRADRAAHALAAVCRKFDVGQNLARLVYKEQLTTDIEVADCRVDPPETPQLAAWLETFAEARRGMTHSTMAEMYLLSMATGLRARALRELEWSMFTPYKRVPGRFYLTVPARLMKNKQAADVPLGPRIGNMLVARKQRAHKNDKFIFRLLEEDRPMANGPDLSKQIRKLYPGDLFGAHDMRKLITHALEFYAGASAGTSDLILGNTPKGTRQKHYANATVKMAELMPYADRVERVLWEGAPELEIVPAVVEYELPERPDIETLRAPKGGPKLDTKPARQQEKVTARRRA